MIELKVNSKIYAGWKTAKITRTWRAIAGGFTLELADRFRAEEQPIPVDPCDPVEVDLLAALSLYIYIYIYIYCNKPRSCYIRVINKYIYVYMCVCVCVCVCMCVCGLRCVGLVAL